MGALMGIGRAVVWALTLLWEPRAAQPQLDGDRHCDHNCNRDWNLQPATEHSDPSRTLLVLFHQLGFGWRPFENEAPISLPLT